jgi:hypothetical protein
MHWACKVMQRTSIEAGGLIGCTPIESVTGETTDLDLDSTIQSGITRTQVSERDYRVVGWVSHIALEV